MPADPTPADRHRAMQLLVAIPDATDRAALVARALADERERARRPFLALAAELVAVADEYRHAAGGSHDAGARNAHYAIARDIRRIAQEDAK